MSETFLPPFSIAREPATAPGVPDLIADLQAELDRHYPPEHNFGLSLEALAAPHIRFFVARDAAGRAAGCCGSKIFDDYCELSRLWVAHGARGHGLARRLVAANEANARAEGRVVMRLETGDAQAEALGLYRALGYRERGPFADYWEVPTSIFMEKNL
ncbi:MAG: GNAT family N-acetyltransferase [Rhizobiales bacterium]|nr:GNAT family N-acetyltransferase [Hyphomicrobiales bacterium]